MTETRTDPSRHLPPRAVLAAVALVLATAGCSALALLVADRRGFVVDLDRHLAASLNRAAFAHPSFTTVMKVISTVGAPGVWWFVLVPALGWLLVAHLWRLAAFVAVTGAGEPLLSTVVKHVVARPRPVVAEPVATAGGWSFPSGHTLAATIGFGVLVVVLGPRLGRAGRRVLACGATVGIAAIGFSRLALGVHFLSDVVGAILLGSAWVIAMAAAFSAWPAD